MSDTLPLTPAHLLCVYAEPLVQGRRVVVIGDASIGLGERLMDLGARSVHVYDSEPLRAAHGASSRGVTTRSLRDDFGVRDGAFDLALLPDLGSLPDPAGVLSRVRRLLGTEGALLASTPNPASAPLRGPDSGERGEATKPGLDYYELYDLVSLQFSNVRMIAQVPFVGVALAELGEADDEPTVSVQTQLVEENEPAEIFVALASQGDVRLDGYTIVQMPSGARAGTEDVDTREHAADMALLAEAQLRADLLASQLEEARGRLQRATVEGERSRRSLDLEKDLVDLKARLEVRNAELEELRTRARQLEGLAEGYAVAESLRGRVRELEAELERALQRNALLEGAARAAEEAAAELEERGEELSRLAVARTEECAVLVAELEALRAVAGAPSGADPELVNELTARAAMLDARAAEIERRAAALEEELGTVHESHAAELTDVEERLRERSRALADAERELRRREAMVRELLSAQDAAPPVSAPPAAPRAEPLIDDGLVRENASLRGKLNALALEVARREGELETRAWRIAELEEAVSRACHTPRAEARAEGNPRADDAAIRERLSRAQDELDMLRQALAQEHEARVRAEGGDELARARAEIERQAALLEKLSKELDARDRRPSATE